MQSNFYEKLLERITSYLENITSSKHPCPQSKLIFVPNLFTLDSRKQSIDYGGGVHIFDEELLFARN